MEDRREAIQEWERAIDESRQRRKKLERQEVNAEGRQRKKGRTGPGRDKMLGERFNAATSRRRRRRKLERAGRRAARKGRR